MTSEATTVGSVTSDDVTSSASTASPAPSALSEDRDAADGVSVLGAGMAHRARSQTVLGRHWSPSGLVGAVGRASVGFGLAVGRSRSIRPTVRFDDLNSAALRPSFDIWRYHRGAGDVATGTVEAASGPAPHETGPARSRAAAPRVTAERARRHPQRRGRPTWTDQIIQRSSIGFVAPAPGSPMPVPAVPTDFVPSGDPKLDQLRLLVRQREHGDAASSARHGSDRSGTPTVDRQPTAAQAADTVLRRTTAAEPTVAAGSDGPGRLARALRPESALAPAVPRARLGSSPAPGGPSADSARGGTTSGGPTSAGAAVHRSASRAQRAPEPTKLDRLRAALIDQGILPAGPDVADGPSVPDAATDRPSDVAVAPAGARPAAPLDRVQRSTDTVAGLHRAATDNARRTTAGPPARSRHPAGDGPAGRQGSAASDGTATNDGTAVRDGTTAAPAAPRLDVTDAASGSATSAPPARGVVPTTPPGSSNPMVDSPTAFRSTERPPSVAQDAASPRTTIDGAVALAERSSEAHAPSPLRSPSPSPPQSSLSSPSALPITSGPAHRLRAQRLLRSGLAPDAPVADAAATLEDRVASNPASNPASNRVGVERVVEALPTTAGVEAVEARSVPTLAPSSRPSPVVVAPSLARIDSPPSTVVRRVTLPRALSSAHRPARYRADLAPSDAAAPSARPIERTSAVRLVDAQASQRVSPADAHRVYPVTRSTTAAGSGALLEVVRRLSAPAAAESSHEPASAARPRSTSDVSRPAIDPDHRRDPAAPMSPISAIAPTVAPPAIRRDAVAGTAAPERAVGPAPVDGRPDTAAGVATAARDATAASVATADERVARPAERVAEQFMTVLSETVQRRPAPLPTSYRPLADAIAGPRPVMLSTDAASRKALRSVGKVAATTGDTIHLDRQAIRAHRLDEVMAHELTHIAHPSPTPRFFDDIDDSPEERRAEQVARVMARSPLAPSATTSAPPVRRGRDAQTIRRSPAPATSPDTSTVSATSLAASLTGTGNSNVIRRWNTATPSTSGPQGPAIGAHRGGAAPAPDPAPSVEAAPANRGDDVFDSPRSAEWFRDQLEVNLDRVVRLLEDRMIVELERRGGRAWRQS